jgi:uncharacterized protein YidB (DUF937 family)
MSGFFSQIVGSVLGSGPAAAAAPALLQEVLGSSGGLSGLLSQFESAGMGEHVQSWVGPGANLPLTAEHVLAAIPPDQLAALGDKVGLPHDQVAALLAQVLPHAVDHATPDGTVPAEGTATPDFTTILGKLFS